MAFVKPKLSEDDFQGSGGNENYGKIVPAGNYTMEIGKRCEVKTSKAGNTYLSVQLNHTGDFSGSKPAFATIMVTGGSTKKLGLFLSALGISPSDWEDEGSGINDPGEGGAADLELTVRGDTVQLEGRTVQAKLEIEEYEGQERNKVAFIVPAAE